MTWRRGYHQTSDDPIRRERVDCIIVRRGNVQEYDRLYKAWGHLVPVIWDRRRARNRPAADADTAPSAPYPNRRRKPPITWTAFGFIEVGRPAAWRQAASSARGGDAVVSQNSAWTAIGFIEVGRPSRRAPLGAETPYNSAGPSFHLQEGHGARPRRSAWSV